MAELFFTIYPNVLEMNMREIRIDNKLKLLERLEKYVY